MRKIENFEILFRDPLFKHPPFTQKQIEEIETYFAIELPELPGPDEKFYSYSIDGDSSIHNRSFGTGLFESMQQEYDGNLTSES